MTTSDVQGHKEQNNQPTPTYEMQPHWDPLLMQPGASLRLVEQAVLAAKCVTIAMGHR